MSPSLMQQAEPYRQFSAWRIDICTGTRPEESADMKRRIHQMSGLRNCLGFLDGTMIVLAKKPMKDGEFYYNRKSVYGLNCQIVADLDTRIQYSFCGYPA